MASRERVWEEMVGIRDHLGNSVKMWCSGNFLKSMRVTLVRTPSNARHVMPSLTARQRLPVLRVSCIQMSCWPRRPLEIPKQSSVMLGQRVALSKLTAGPRIQGQSPHSSPNVDR